jgi:putative photosynthetic complex assembly protein 2
MRISAKLMVFFGAPNLSAHFLPRHLDYLKSYFGRGSSPAFIALAICVVSGATAILGYQAVLAPTGGFEATSSALLATLAALALFEHVALVLPLRDSALWAWAYRQPSISPTTLTTTKKRDIAPSEWSQ